MTTVAQKVRDAVERGKPGEALLILAAALDSVTVHEQRTIATDGDWSLPVLGESPRQQTLPDEPPSEPEDRRAWEAAKRLQQDTEPTPDIGVDRTRLESIKVGDGVEIRVPSAPEETRSKRLLVAMDLGLGKEAWWSRPELALSVHEALQAYVKGGPIWLHAYDRDFVMGLPAHLRRAMVQDVESYSPGDAHLLGRDILKDLDPAANRGVQLEALS